MTPKYRIAGSCLVLLTLVALPAYAGVKQAGAELLARVQQAYDRSASMKSEAGEYTLRLWHKQPGKTETDSHGEASVAISGDKFNISVKWLTGKKTIAHEYAYDGKRLVCEGHSVAKSSAREADSIRRWFTARRYLDPRRIYYFYKPNETRIVGKELVNGVECLMLEGVHRHIEKDGGRRIETLRIWVAPSMDYTVHRFRHWIEGGMMKPLGAKSLYRELNVQFGKYNNGQWRPAVVTRDEYRVDAKTGNRYRDSRLVKTYSPDYKLNTPVETPIVSAILE
ncbi:MAG: hypothetical protein Q7T82_12095 [Armatimonadota bacterium]|nr:hypothetical protein [Armatimonadota bacterium]